MNELLMNIYGSTLRQICDDLIKQIEENKDDLKEGGLNLSNEEIKKINKEIELFTKLLKEPLKIYLDHCSKANNNKYSKYIKE